MSIRRDERAVSEVVGALLLVVVVTAAVASFAAFTLDQQEKVQELKAQQQRREAEDFRVVSVTPTTDGGDPGQWGTLEFTVQALSTQTSSLLGVEVNDEQAVEFTLFRYQDLDGDGTFVWEEYRIVADPDPLADSPKEDDLELDLLPRERFRVLLTRDNDDFSAQPTWLKDAYVTFAFQTGWLNTFETTYLPPTAVGTAFQVDGDTFVLDASLSDHPGDGARIVDWEWVSGAVPTGCTDNADRHGRLSSVDTTGCAAGTHAWAWTLTVEDNHGFTAAVDVTFAFTV